MARTKKQILQELAELRPQIRPGTTAEDLINRAKQREGKQAMKKSGKTQVGAMVDRDLWTKVRIKGVRENRSSGEILEEAIRNYFGMGPAAAEKPKPNKTPQVSTKKNGQGADQAEVERFVLERQDQKAREIAEELNQAGYRTIRGKEFNEGAVNKIRWKAKQRG